MEAGRSVAVPDPSNSTFCLMPISVDVYLMSGKMVSLEVEGEASVNTLRLRAQSALGVGN